MRTLLCLLVGILCWGTTATNGVSQTPIVSQGPPVPQLLATETPSSTLTRPNILWVIVDDMSANFSCYGESQVETPHVDALARRGVLFTKAFVTAPVCSTCRSAFITGMYQTSIGAHHHRSGRGEKKIHLPDGIVPVPSLFQEAGYFTSLSGWPIQEGKLGKSDYNFEWDTTIYDGSDWSQRADDQPFFAQIQLPGGKLREGTASRVDAFRANIEQHFSQRSDPADVVLPPYYPRLPEILNNWADYLDTVRETDRVFGEIIERLRSHGDLDNTVIFFMTDHGISHARGKQFLYEEGIHVPLVIAGPNVPAAIARTDLVEHVDIAATSLALAGIDVPDLMQAQDILSPDYQIRDAIFSARDRCDETVDHLRCVRTQRYKYIRNFLPHRPHLQPNAYKDNKAILIALRKANAAGELNELQASLFKPMRPPEELYDLDEDPFEINNLAEDPAHQQTLERMRRRLVQWMEDSGDQGREPEPMEMYDSDMAPYLSKTRQKNPSRLAELEGNIKQMKDWAADGK